MTETFNDLYLHELELLASAEQQMIDLLEQLAGGTDTEELRRAFQRQGDGCTEQRSVVIALIKEVGGKDRVALGHGMKGLIDECLVLLKEFPTGNLRDAVMIAHLQRAEHYKMAAYTSVRDYAKLLGKKEAVVSLDHALKLTTGASKDLGSIAIQINAEAYVDTRLAGT